MSTLAQRVLEARARKGVTQSVLAKAVGISRAAVAQWESGETKTINSEHLHSAAAFLNCRARWLATGKGPRGAAFSVREKQSDYEYTDAQRATIDLLLSLSPDQLAVAHDLILLTRNAGLVKKGVAKNRP